MYSLLYFYILWRYSIFVTIIFYNCGQTANIFLLNHETNLNASLIFFYLIWYLMIFNIVAVYFFSHVMYNAIKDPTMVAVLNESDSIIAVYVLFYIFCSSFLTVVWSSYELLNWFLHIVCDHGLRLWSHYRDYGRST